MIAGFLIYHVAGLYVNYTLGSQNYPSCSTQCAQTKNLKLIYLPFTTDTFFCVRGTPSLKLEHWERPQWEYQSCKSYIEGGELHRGFILVTVIGLEVLCLWLYKRVVLEGDLVGDCHDPWARHHQQPRITAVTYIPAGADCLGEGAGLTQFFYHIHFYINIHVYKSLGHPDWHPSLEINFVYHLMHRLSRFLNGLLLMLHMVVSELM